jgi:outer membrane protein
VSKSSYYPQLTPSYTYKTSNSDHNTYSLQQTAQGSSIALQQTILDSGQRQLGVGQSRDSVRGAVLGVEDTRATVILNVTTGYYDLLRTKELVRVAESSLERARTTLEATKAFVAAGSSARKDILQAQADYSNADVQVISARNNVRLAETSLRTAMGVMQPQAIVTPSEPVPTPTVSPDTKTIPEYVDEAMSHRPDLKRSEASLDSTRKSVRLAKIEAGPSLTSSLTGAYTAHPNAGVDRIIAVSVTYPLFDAGAARARVREAKAGVTGAEAELELSRQAIAADVESAYLTREEARQQITAAQSALDAARENYNSATQSQKEGVGTILDVITAENSLVTAETNAVQAIYDFYTADARLKRAIGANDPYSVGGKS